MNLYDTSEIFELLKEGKYVSGYVLDLTIYEFANVVWKNVLRKRLDKNAGLDLLRLFLEQDIEIIRVDPEDGKGILSLAIEKGLTAYDAAYLFYARKYGLNLKTRDKKLSRVWEEYGDT